MPPEILQTLAGYDPDVGKNRAEARGIMKPEVAFNAQGWFMTGDLGWLDDAGYLYITDRKRDNWADGDIRLRRVSLVATRPGEGILSEPVAGTRLGSQELVLLPHTCHSRYPPGSAQLGGQRKFAPDFCVS